MINFVYSYKVIKNDDFFVKNCCNLALSVIIYRCQGEIPGHTKTKRCKTMTKQEINETIKIYERRLKENNGNDIFAEIMIAVFSEALDK